MAMIPMEHEGGVETATFTTTTNGSGRITQATGLPTIDDSYVMLGAIETSIGNAMVIPTWSTLYSKWILTVVQVTGSAVVPVASTSVSITIYYSKA